MPHRTLRRRLRTAAPAALALALATSAWADGDIDHQPEPEAPGGDTPPAAIASLFAPHTACDPAPPVPQIDRDRSLWIHDEATLEAPGVDFSLRRTLTELATQANAAGASGTTATDIFRELWDTQNPAPGLGLGAHCDDQSSPGITGPTLNGYPHTCRPGAGAQATGNGSLSPDDFLDDYFPIGLVNRFDLADEDWKTCGQYSVVYANIHSVSGYRSFIIFEAALPNPAPGCRDGCRPVAELWADLSLENDPTARAQTLEAFFYHGNSALRPAVHIDHYSFGPTSGYGPASGGQIRTNDMQAFPASLKEFKLALVDPGTGSVQLDVVPVPVALNPFGALFDGALPGTASPYAQRADDFQTAFVAQLDTLDRTDINTFSYRTASVHDAAESPVAAASVQDYGIQIGLPGSWQFHWDVATHPSPLSPEQFANRALALSCAGCHQPTAFGLDDFESIAPSTHPLTTPWGGSFAPSGTTTRWPDSIGGSHVYPFTHVIHPLSEALEDVFLPFRETVLTDYLGATVCPCLRDEEHIPMPEAHGAEDLIQQIWSEHQPTMAALRAELASIEPTVDTLPTIIDLRAQADDVWRSADAATIDAFAAHALELTPLGAELEGDADVLWVDAYAAADGDPELAALLVTAEVQAINASNPRPLTATGVLRTH